MMNNNNMKAMMEMVKLYGLDDVIAAVKEADNKVRIMEAKWDNLISPYEYSIAGHVGKKPVFPEWVSKVFDTVTKEMNVNVSKWGDGKAKNLAITNVDFAKYIIYTTNDNGDTFRSVLEVLLACPAWCKGYGITRFRMELVAHMLILHGNNDTVKRELKKFLGKYDQTTVKVLAALDDNYRGILNREIQMISYTEKRLLPVIGDEAKFAAGATA